ncbi:hypothetical protein GQ464_003260 [Rhodocaloribacter litoris]|uniref:hypothetical protein n=1 Tax=Rhodocaloribacter litoris TaxID=2558931 RepID=UPI00141F8C89|nr:hypothetical protein [Rhodocaloribacter litoris]QXD15982.1 hypothetical protein GQ464_003260 [Rhodocaloribacter litoris]
MSDSSRQRPRPAPRPQLELFETPPAPPSTPATASSVACAYWDYCPNCGARLHNQGCKYRCPRCHYFMSCSDFD